MLHWDGGDQFFSQQVNTVCPKCNITISCLNLFQRSDSIFTIYVSEAEFRARSIFLFRKHGGINFTQSKCHNSRHIDYHHIFVQNKSGLMIISTPKLCSIDYPRQRFPSNPHIAFKHFCLTIFFKNKQLHLICFCQLVSLICNWHWSLYSVYMKAF